MVTQVGIILLLISTSLSTANANGFWKDYDINDPNLTPNIAGRQCQKSLMYAPEKLQAWCEKSYELGNWESLEVIGLHTGDGSRYVAEVKKHVKAGDANALKNLGWLYSRGRFVERDIPLAISLFNRYLTLGGHKSLNINQLRFAHEELYELYRKINEIEKSSEHLQFLIDNAEDEYYKNVLIRRMEELKQSI